MKYYVYQITNLITKRFYIGVHKSVNILQDNYFGSGIKIKNSIKKHGKQNFKKEILAEFINKEDAYLLESRLVTKETIKDLNLYNIKPGGFGGWNFTLTEDKLKSRNINISNTLKGRTRETHSYLIDMCAKSKASLHKIKDKLSFIRKQAWINNRHTYMKGAAKTALKNRGKTKENCQGKLAQSIKISGENNCMYRQEVLEKFIGKTKENCEWRLRQSISVANTQANYTIERKKEIAEKISKKVSGVNNGMYGKYGELSPVNKYRKEQKDLVIDFYIQGFSRKEIAVKTEVHYQSVKKIIQSYLKGIKNE